jgi:hypothetical protein
MGSVCSNQSDPEKTGTDKEGNNEKRTHKNLPTPRDWACGSENDSSPAFIKFGVQPSQIGDEYLSLNGRDERSIQLNVGKLCRLEQTFSLPESYSTRISDTWDWIVGSVPSSSFKASIDSSRSLIICGT